MPSYEVEISVEDNTDTGKTIIWQGVATDEDEAREKAMREKVQTSQKAYIVQVRRT